MTKSIFLRHCRNDKGIYARNRNGFNRE